MTVNALRPAEDAQAAAIAPQAAAVAARLRQHQSAALAYAQARKATGHAVPTVRVGPAELTCVNCWETFGVSTPVTGEATFCWRCGCSVGIPTAAYLYEWEREPVR